jgi:hypothetical protein
LARECQDPACETVALPQDLEAVGRPWESRLRKVVAPVLGRCSERETVGHSGVCVRETLTGLGVNWMRLHQIIEKQFGNYSVVMAS